MKELSYLQVPFLRGLLGKTHQGPFRLNERILRSQNTHLPSGSSPSSPSSGASGSLASSGALPSLEASGLGALSGFASSSLNQISLSLPLFSSLASSLGASAPSSGLVSVGGYPSAGGGGCSSSAFFSSGGLSPSSAGFSGSFGAESAGAVSVGAYSCFCSSAGAGGASSFGLS